MFRYECCLCKKIHSLEGIRSPPEMMELKLDYGPKVEVIFACRIPCNPDKLKEFTDKGWVPW